MSNNTKGPGARRPFYLTDEIKLEWIEDTVNYLRDLNERPITALEGVLRVPGTLQPVFMYKGEFLLKPGQKANKAWYLRRGRAKLYCYDEDQVRIMYIWEEGSIIVLFKKFRKKLPNGKYYIELMTDAELVSITNFRMDAIYEAHTVAHELTEKILCMKTDRRNLQLEILQMPDKKRRYCRFKVLFPSLFNTSGKSLLSIAEICAFINVTDSTLAESKKLCPDRVRIG